MIRNIAVLLGGTVAAQAFTLLITPVLSRLYSPEEFGKLGLILATSSIFATGVHGRLTLAIARADTSGESFEIFRAATVLSASITACLVCLFILARVFGALPTYSISSVFLIGVFVFLSAQIEVFNYWQSSKKKFFLSARNAATRSLVTGFLQLALAAKSASGMIVGALLGAMCSVLLSMREQFEEPSLVPKKRVSILFILKKYRNYPLYSMPQGMLASMSLNSVPICLAHYFGASIAGQYWMAYRILVAPIGLFGGAYRQVIHAKLSTENCSASQKNRTARIHTAFLSALILPFSVGIAVWGEVIFIFAFGERWAEAGIYSGYLVFCFSLDLVKIPAITILQNRNEQARLLIYESVLSVSRIAVVVFSAAFFDAFLAIKAFSVVSAFAAIFLVVYGLRRVDGDTDTFS